MTKKIYRAIVLAATVVLLASLVIIMGCLYGYFGSVQETMLKDQLTIAAAGVEGEGLSFLEKLSSDRYRLTWVNADGNVLCDTQAKDQSLENHAERPEIRAAQLTGQGESTRYSATLMEKTMYYARRLDDGTVLRISDSRATAGVLALGMFQPFVLVLLAALVFSGVLARRLSKHIVEPLNQLDLEHPLENNAYEELSPLLGRINRQHLEIRRQMQLLKQRTDEFAQIIASMREGLVLLDERGTVLSINSAARALFNADDGCVGQDFLTVERSYDVSAAIHRAMEDGHSEIRCERQGRVYQFDISRIDSDGAAMGAVLLAFDITEQEYAERNRREFTANVSHELKTPLQGIIGSAELIENGMVTQADMPRFIGHIRDEASRLVTLIGDIIRLAQLDEGGEMPREQMNLLDVAAEAAEGVRDAAAARKISMTVNGDAQKIDGVRRLVYEVIYNLCDNAVKYNREGGDVKVTVGGDEASAFVEVADTGIGIPPEDQSRVFERFYRVDKSHSKASGGTGLGLSIVKHAAAYHHAKIELESAEGEGTTIRVIFPL